MMEKGSKSASQRRRPGVLKPESKLVIVEYKKIETPSGPPVTIRLSEEELGEITARFGFRKDRYSTAQSSWFFLTSVFAGVRVLRKSAGEMRVGPSESACRSDLQSSTNMRAASLTRAVAHRTTNIVTTARTTSFIISTGPIAALWVWGHAAPAVASVIAAPDARAISIIPMDARAAATGSAVRYTAAAATARIARRCQMA